MDNKNKAIAEAHRLTKLTGIPHSVFKNLGGYEVVSEVYEHTAMGVCVYVA